MFHGKENGACYLDALRLLRSAKELKVSKCAAASYGSKQGGLLCKQTLREVDGGSAHVSVSAFLFFYMYVPFNRFCHVNVNQFVRLVNKYAALKSTTRALEFYFAVHIVMLKRDFKRFL